MSLATKYFIQGKTARTKNAVSVHFYITASTIKLNVQRPSYELVIK